MKEFLSNPYPVQGLKDIVGSGIDLIFEDRSFIVCRKIFSGGARRV